MFSGDSMLFPILKGVLLLFVFTILAMALRTVRFIRIGRGIAERAKGFERVRPEASFRILVVGDSTAVGTGAGDPLDSVAGRLGREFPEAEILNRGINGLRTGEVPTHMPASDGRMFDLVFVQTGGNDVLCFTSLWKLHGEITVTLDRAKRIGHTVFLLTAGDIGRAPFFPWPVGRLFTRRTRLVRAIFQAAAKERGVHYVDLFTAQVDDVFASDPKRYYAADFLHPGSDGYRVWYQVVREKLREAGVGAGTGR